MKKMLKRADGSTSQRGLWDNIRAKAASNKKTGKKGKAPSEDILKQERAINAKKTGGKSMSSFLEDSKELKFGGPSKRKYLVGGPETTPTMTPQQALTEMGAGRMTGAQANAATGYGNKPKKYTNAENIDNLKKVFSGSSTVDAQGNVVPKPKKPMADISTAGLRPMAPAESTTAYTGRLKSGGKKKMGGKNC